MSSSRPVHRVLVMIQYAENEPGEVYDLTALAVDLRSPTDAFSAHIDLKVEAQRTYTKDKPVEQTVSWSGYCSGGGFTGSSSHLEDVINAALPDGPRVEDLKKKVQRYRQKADKLEWEAKYAKIEQVAAVRHMHPIAHVARVPTLTEFPADKA